jgi:V/A-type H+-transporting ATPase subunit I
MQKIVVIGISDFLPKTLSLLHDLKVVQIEPIKDEILKLAKLQSQLDIGKIVAEEYLRIRALKTALPPKPVKEKRKFSNIDEVLEVCKSVNIDDVVSQIKKEQSEIQVRIEQLKNILEIAKNLSYINEDLSIFTTSSTSSFFAILKKENFEKIKDFMKKLNANVVYNVSEEKDRLKVIFIVNNKDLEKFGSAIQKVEAKFYELNNLKGTPKEIIDNSQKEISKLLKRENELKEKLNDLADKYYSILLIIEEQLSIEQKKIEVLTQLARTENVFIIEGWVPKKRLDLLKESIEKIFRGRVLVFEKEDKENPPTLMSNPQKLKFFESFIRFYSLPQPYEFDPTFVFSLIFPIFFGLMLGDVGYSVLIILISYWIIRRVKYGGKTIVPAWIRRFARNIFRPSAFAKIARAMLVGGFIGIIFGFLFNEYFGFKLNQYLFIYLNENFNLHLPEDGTFIEPLASYGLKTLLLISGYFGLSLVSLGLIAGFLNYLWINEKRHAIGKLGWLFVAWGISLIGLSLLKRQPISLGNFFIDLYIALIISGLLMISLGEGTSAIIELPSIISHILSYTRLVGILLASIVLASVIDRIFLNSIYAGFFNAIIGTVVLIIGQGFNFVIALFEPGIQGARLLYVEFFSKFFKGGGRPFQPFGSQRKYTLNEIDVEELLSKKT